MAKQKYSEDLKCVFVVMCYQNIVGIYADQEDACQVQRECINKNRPADVLCRSVIYPVNAQ